MVAEPSEKKKSTPEFRPGDTVRVHIKVIEGDSERVQMFEGTVISRRGSGDSQSFTVRKISFGVGVERTFPVNSPHIDRIEVVKTGRVRRARLYYLRNLTGKAARVADEKGPEDKAGPASAAAPAPASKDEPPAKASGKAAETPKKDTPAKEAKAAA